MLVYTLQLTNIHNFMHIIYILVIGRIPTDCVDEKRVAELAITLKVDFLRTSRQYL